MPTIDIVITSFNGRDLLKNQLPVVLDNSPQANQIIVIDDASSDDTISFLRQEYPDIKTLHNLKNLGFTRSTNIAVAQSDADFVVLLNNDVYPQPHYLKKALAFFDDPKVFAVNFNEANSSWPNVSWHGGKLQYFQAVKTDQAVLTAWGSGGSSIIRRSHWVALGGFNPIYSPGYWEDIDLGWRAWRSGYKIIWTPQSQVIHRHETTFNLLDPNYVSLIKQRNELLFTWQNITQANLIREHFQFLFSYSLTHPGYLKVIFAALKQLKNLRRLKSTPFSDSYVLHTVNQPYHD